MPQFEDYSKWLTNERIVVEEKAWAQAKLHVKYAAHIHILIEWYKINRILELGCGSGWVPTQLEAEISYLGVDSNKSILELARKKNPSRVFFSADVRQIDYIKNLNPPHGLVCSFAVLKHFSLDEFEKVFSGMLELAPYGLFTMNFASVNRDDGTQFHHTWITPDFLQEILDKSRFRLLYRINIWEGVTWEKKAGEESIFAVQRKL